MNKDQIIAKQVTDALTNIVSEKDDFAKIAKTAKQLNISWYGLKKHDLIEKINNHLYI
jgi:hypothetical protein